MITKDKILSLVHETFYHEIKTLQNVKNQISDRLTEIIFLLHQCHGKIVITGIGKSAIVGQKIVATLNSTGSTATFLHAGDAIHGDLGVISEHDIILMLSKSGETEEMKVLLPYIKEMGNIIVVMVSNPDSFLAMNSDHHIHLPVPEEADPNNLAPTSSTTAQLVMGDAIAIALLYMNGFSSDEFARLHPGGTLGKRLNWRVRDLLRENARPAVSVQSNLKDVIIEMTRFRLGATVVKNSEELIVGIITDGDLRRMLQSKETTTDLKAGDIMSGSPKLIQAEAKAMDALNLMNTNSISQLIVMEGSRYISIIHIHDLLKEGLV